MPKVHQDKMLNPEQDQAVHFGKGPLLIIAGAGTGKTTVVTERIKYLITAQNVKPTEVLALTFTEKAARQMQERVDVAMPYGYTNMWISTFHSFCDRILRQEAVHIGLAPNYRLLSDTDLTMLIRKNLFAFDLHYFRPLGNPTKFINGLLIHFSRLQDEDVNTEQYLEWVAQYRSQIENPSEEETQEIHKYEELSRAFAMYEALKTREGVLDFSDLIVKTLHLFRIRKNILRKYQDQFQYILVDEFQDTNIAQNELIRLLSGKRQNITAVADDDQCLPPTAKISTINGDKEIQNVTIGEKVLTAVGKGYLSSSVVSRIFRTNKTTRFLSFTTESGKRLTLTDNHKMFCMIPGRKFEIRKFFYIYLMWRCDMGWRLGITDDIAQRLRLERSADKIVVIKSCTSLEEAKFNEVIFSMKYQIPTYPFKPRKQMKLTGVWLKKLFTEFDTEKNASKLATDLGIKLDAHHYCLSGVVRGTKERIKINLTMCHRSHRTKWADNRLLSAPKVLHEVALETSSLPIRSILDKEGISTTRTKKGIKVRKLFSDLKAAGDFAEKLQKLTSGILECRFSIGKRNAYSRTALVLPAGNVLVGMYIPVLKNYEVVYERVVERTEEIKTSDVYDLEIDNTHNFIADGIAVHNSIYKFRGAAVSNVIAFRKHFPKAELVVLSKNYRSTQTILDQSYRLIQHNNPDRLEVKEGISKKLHAMREKKGKPVVFIHADRVENEADLVAKEIVNLVQTYKKDEASWKDVAVLVRANNHAEPFVRAFTRHGIPYQFLGPGQLFRQPEVKELISYLQVLVNFEDTVALFKVLSMQYFDLSPRDLVALANFARRNSISLFEAGEVVCGMRPLSNARLPSISDDTKTKLSSIVQMIGKHLGLITKETAGQLLYYFLEDTGMLKNILEYKFPLDEKKAGNITKFFNKLKTFEAEHEDASVATVLDWILLAMELGESPIATDTDWTENDAVNILTVHSAKGLEFKFVFLVNLVSSRFPTIERKEQIPIPDALVKEELPEGDFHEEEERRLFYVGMTRACDLLYLTAANFYGEGKREKKISSFVYEALGEQVAQNTALASSQLSLLEWRKETPPPTPPPELHKVTYLSYSQIESFRLCPLHYKLRYMLNITSPPSPALSFGSSVHAALRDFYLGLKSGEPSTEEHLLKLLHHNWLREGYSSKRYESEMMKRGEEYLRTYFHKEFVPSTTEGFKPGVNTVLIEQPFTIPISAANGFLKIGGKIDRVDEVGGGKIEIIDYKTGRMPSKRDLDSNLQLSMYAIAATEIVEPPFKRRAEDILLTLYYFDLGEKITTTRTQAQLEAEKLRIITIAREIEHSDFTCSHNQLCTNCEYKMFCGISGD